LSARPTQPAQGLPTAAPPPLPFMEGRPLLVELYGLGFEVLPGLAPCPFWSAEE